jgi:hypothetical protein
MILGLKNNKIKIKTDSPKGLRAVECACCCGFSPFSPTPINTNKVFKYLTYESTITPYNVGEINLALPSWELQCAPAGADEDGNVFYTCSPYSKAQRTQSESYQIKITQALSKDCSCEVVKAWGTHSKSYEIWGDDGSCYFTFDDTCWIPVMKRSFSAAIQDAEWSTWADNGKLFLDQKTQNATWMSAFCTGNDGEFIPGVWDNDAGAVTEGQWVWGPTMNNPTSDIGGIGNPVCPSGGVGCADVASGPSWNFSSAVEGGGFSFVEATGPVGSVVLYDTVYAVQGTIRQTLHNTLQEIWGPNQLEMRP